MAIQNPIQFVSRTFNTILNDINSDPELADKPNWFKRIWAGIGDVFSMWVNAMGNNLVLRTSYTRQNTADLLELINYYLSPQTTADGEVIFYLNTAAVFPFTILQSDLKAQTPGSLAVSAKIFEARSDESVSEDSIVVTAANVNPATDIFTVTRAFITGEKITITSADPPAPLVAGTEYWTIRVSDTEIKVAASLSDAYAGTAIDLTDAGTGAHTVTLYSIRVQVYQQELQSSRVVGTSDGTTAFQEFSLGEPNILEDTITVTINSVVYTRVDTLVFSEPTDTHFEVIYSTSNVATIRFGNGTYGAVPAAFDINVEFAIGGGNDSNVSSVDRLNIYAGTDGNVVAISNPTTLSGGSAPEDVESGKRLGPLLLKTRDRFITTTDGQALAEDFGGVSIVRVNGNQFGPLSAQIVIVPDGGGNSSAQFKTDLDQHLTDRSILESIDIRVVDATYLTQNVSATIKVLPGFSYINIEPFIEIAFKLFFSETGTQIVQDFQSNGIASAVTLVNTLFSTAFTTDDYNQMERLIENLSPRQVGVNVQESDVQGYIDSFVNGVDYLDISSPSFPIIVDTDEITTDGTINVSEIV